MRVKQKCLFLLILFPLFLFYIQKALAETDATPPAKINDLTVTSCTAHSCTLSWTSPGDDGNTGQASSYELRWNTIPITESNWNYSFQIFNELIPKPSGNNESLTVTGLVPNTHYYFAIKAIDEAGNEGELSNLANATTDQSQIIFEDNFDNSPEWHAKPKPEGYYFEGPPNWDGYSNAQDYYGHPLFNVDSTDPRGSSGKSLRVYYEYFDTGPKVTGGRIFKFLTDPHDGTKGYEEIYIRWYQKFNIWDWPDTKYAFLKMIRVYLGRDADEPCWHCESHVKWFLILQARGGPPAVRPNFFDITIGNNINGTYTKKQINFNNVHLPDPGEWHCYELHVKLNTIYPTVKDDAFCEFYIDGQKAFEYNNFRLREDDIKINLIYLADNMHNLWEKEQTGTDEIDYSIDDVVISTSYVGPDYVIGGLHITTDSLSDGEIQSQYSTTLSAAGGTTPYTWSIISGNLPPGLTLNSNGVISGTPTKAGTFTFTIKVTDSSNPVKTATKEFSITVNEQTQPLTITTEALPDGIVGTQYSATLSASGGTAPYTWSLVSGSLPTDLTLSNAGVISGTPSAAGTYNFTVKVEDSSSPKKQATKQLSINVNEQTQPLTITTEALPDGIVGTQYSATLSASGGIPPYTWSISSGSLPNGLILSPSTGAISGTPIEQGTYNFTVQVQDADSNTAAKNLSITINPSDTTPPVRSNGERNKIVIGIGIVIGIYTFNIVIIGIAI